MSKRKAYLYQRFSSDRQKGNSSLFRQSEAQRIWLIQNPDVEVVESLVDDGFSGFKGEHLTKGSLGVLVGQIEQGLIEKGSLILVEQFSRLSRLSIDDTETLLKKIWNGGITVVTVRDNQAYPPESVNDMSKRIQLLVEIERAYKDSKWRSDKQKASHLKRRHEAQQKLTAPRIRKPFWLGVDGKLNQHAEAVKDMFTLYLSGLGQVSILNELRVKYPDFIPIQKMTSTTVIRTIINQQCIGLMFGVKVYEPVVTDDIFYQAQKIHTERLFKNVKPNRKWPLHGLVKCAHCGKGMGIQQTGDSLPLLRCSNKRRLGSELSGCDSNATFPYIIADHFFNMHVEVLLLAQISNSEVLESEKVDLRRLEHTIKQKTNELNEINEVITKASNEGKSLTSLLNMMVSTETLLEKLVAEHREMDYLSRSEKSFYISSDVLKRRDEDPDLFNINLHLLGFRMSIEKNTISYGNLKLEYIKYDRSTKTYKCAINGSNISIQRDGIKPECFLNSRPLNSETKQLKNVMYDVLNEFNSNVGSNSVGEMTKLISKHFLKMKKN
jgi:hypothetical protein